MKTQSTKRTIRTESGLFATVIDVTWTPGEVSHDPRCRFPSTWRDPIGKPLTNARIRALQRDGWYGQEVKAALERKAIHRSPGIIFRCACGAVAKGHYAYLYLPKPGDYCAICLLRYRTAAKKERELDRQFKENLAKEFV